VLDNLVGHRADYEYLAAVLFIHKKYCMHYVAIL
jgi:hypothetical protein